MKRLYYFYILLQLTPCKYSENKEANQVEGNISPNIEVGNEGLTCSPNTSEINAIVRAVIEADPLRIEKSNVESIPLSRELQRIKFLERQRAPQPPITSGISRLCLTDLPDFIRESPDITFAYLKRFPTFSLDTALYSEYLIRPFHQLERQYPCDERASFLQHVIPIV